MADVGAVAERLATGTYEMCRGVYAKVCELAQGYTSPPRKSGPDWLPTCLCMYYNNAVELLALLTDPTSENPLLELIIRIFDILFTIYLAIISLILYVSMNLIDATNCIIWNLSKEEESVSKESSTASEE